MRLELTRSCDHYPLKVACIPISPPAREFFVPRTGLEPAHLAACAPETHASTKSAIWAKKKSGKRDSNSRPQPWQGCALPTELFPHTFYSFYQVKERCFLSKAGAKVLLFFELTKFFSKKMQKKCNYTHPSAATTSVENIKTGICLSNLLLSCDQINHRCQAQIGRTHNVQK